MNAFDDPPHRPAGQPAHRLSSTAGVTGQARPAGQGTSTHRWTFLTNHAHVLILIDSQHDLVLRQIAQQVGITERAVQRIIHELEEAGYLTIRREGRRNRYRVVADRPLRHPIESSHSIGELLALIGSSGSYSSSGQLTSGQPATSDG